MVYSWWFWSTDDTCDIQCSIRELLCDNGSHSDIKWVPNCGMQRVNLTLVTFRHSLWHLDSYTFTFVAFRKPWEYIYIHKLAIVIYQKYDIYWVGPMIGESSWYGVHWVIGVCLSHIQWCRWSLWHAKLAEAALQSASPTCLKIILLTETVDIWCHAKPNNSGYLFLK